MSSFKHAISELCTLLTMQPVLHTSYTNDASIPHELGCPCHIVHRTCSSFLIGENLLVQIGQHCFAGFYSCATYHNIVMWPILQIYDAIMLFILFIIRMWPFLQMCDAILAWFLVVDRLYLSLSTLYICTSSIFNASHMSSSMSWLLCMSPSLCNSTFNDSHIFYRTSSIFMMSSMYSLTPLSRKSILIISLFY